VAVELASSSLDLEMKKKLLCFCYGGDNMQFRFRDAPIWFSDHLMENYINELHELQKKENRLAPNFDETGFKRIAVEFFTTKGFKVWLDSDLHLWFDVDFTGPKWTYEILRSR
jgi:hypothetical protein